MTFFFRRSLKNVTVYSNSRFLLPDKKTDNGLASVNGFGDFPYETMSSQSESAPRSFLDEKERLWSLPKVEKRKLYACGNDFLQLKDIAAWPEFYKQNSYEIHKLRLSDSQKENALRNSSYEIDNELNKKISVFTGDITTLEIDAIVNAANNSLLGGGGVDGAIHRAAGKNLLAECQTLNGCDTGDAKLTGGYKLPAKAVIHTVGPRGEKPTLLEACYRRSMQTAVENKIRSIAFPCISTGVYGYPNEAAVKVVLPTIRTMLEAHRDDFDRVIFCLFLKVDREFYMKYLPVFFPISP